MISFKLFS